VKRVLAVTLAAMFLLFAIFQLRASHPLASLVSSSSQIYIHGTPVCVFQQGKDIMAKVGECGMEKSLPGAESLERLPFHGYRGGELPPGHPPIDQNMFPEEQRRVLI
jgi:hypothetical protein